MVAQRRVKLGIQNVMTKAHSKWQYATKFGFDTGQSKYSVRLKCIYPLAAPPDLEITLEAYMDEEWPEAEAIEDPCERKKKARKTFTLKYGDKREWGEFNNGTIKQTVRPHVWFFALSSCGSELDARTLTLMLEIEARQASGSHFSVESRWAPTANFLVLVACTLFLLLFWRQARQFSEDVGELHPVVWTLASAALVLYGAQVLHAIHLYYYSYNGTGVKATEILAEILFMLSQVIQSTLLVLIALGYTLSRSKIGSLEFVIPICVIVAMVHILLVVFDKAQGEYAEQFTEHEGFKGWLTLVVRIGLYVWFQCAARKTATEGGLRIQNFMVRFKLAASLYFLAYPVLFFLVKVCAAYVRRPLMEAGLMGAQIGSNLWLATLFLTKGEYFQASCLSSSPLPGAGSPTRFYKDD